MPPKDPGGRVVHRNAGVDPRFRVVDAPLDLGFALVSGVGRVPTQGVPFRTGLRHSPRSFVRQK